MPANAIIFFLYYMVVGPFALMSKAAGIDPFKTGENPKTYWTPVEETQYHTVVND